VRRRPWHCNLSTSRPVPPPPRRLQGPREAVIPVAKLIDISKCIGCKACQVACMQWNDLRDEVGSNVGCTTTPWTHRPVVDGDALLRSGSAAGPAGMADPQGRLHALRRPRLPEGLPGTGAIVQYSNGIVDFHEENCIAAATASPAAPSTSRASRRRTARPTSAPCVPTGWRWGWSPRA